MVHIVRRPVLLGVIVASATAVAAVTYRVQQQRSLQQGIAQTQQGLDRVNGLLDENQAEIDRLLARVEIDLGQNIEELPQVELPVEQRNLPLGTAVDVFKTASAFKAVTHDFQAVRANRSPDYQDILEQTAEAVAGVWGELDPTVSGTVMKCAPRGIDAVADLWESELLIRQQQQLIRNQAVLQQQLLRLHGSDPQTAAEWQQILTNLHGDPAKEHQAFLKWLAVNGLSEKDVVAKALGNAAISSPAIVSQVASGMTIFNPSQAADNLSDIPGVNPDFVAAIQCTNYVSIQAMSDPRWLRFTCDHYPEDGTFIPAFGPCRRIDFSNPFTGGLIHGGSAGACRAKVGGTEGGVKLVATITYLGRTCKVQLVHPPYGINNLSVRSNDSSLHGMLAIFDSREQLVAWINGYSVGDFDVPPGRYVGRFYEGVSCCGYHADGRTVFDLPGPGTQEVADLHSVTPTDTFEVSVQSDRMTETEILCQ